jgi:hypothetical protein
MPRGDVLNFGKKNQRRGVLWFLRRLIALV